MVSKWMRVMFAMAIATTMSLGMGCEKEETTPAPTPPADTAPTDGATTPAPTEPAPAK